MLNKILLIGDVGKDPELQVTTEGTPYTKFSLAVNRKYKANNGEQKEEAEWFKGGIREQTLKTFEHIKMVLAAAGADLTNIVKLTIYLSDVADQNVINEVSAEMFGTQIPPPRTVVQVAALNHVNMKLEIDVIAAV